jgi:ABC-2 type transport system ATP-binding protein
MANLENISIKTDLLSKVFKNASAINSLTSEFEPGLLHGIIGPDGAGKTTFLRILSGLLHPSGGSVSYFSSGRNIEFEEVRPFIGYMPSRASLYPDLSIEEHLQFFKSLYSLDVKYFKEKSSELLHVTRLDKFKERKIKELSGGMYKKAGLMCALLQSPSVLLLDEPTNGVDPISRKELWELLYELLNKKILIIVSTAYMDEAKKCAKVHLMDDGRFLFEGTPEEILKKNSAKDFSEIFIKAENK